MLRKIAGTTLIAACTYTLADAVNDALMYSSCKSLILTRLPGHQRFQSEVGGVTQVGPWYNSSVSISPGGMMATVTIPVVGKTKSSDVVVKVVRKSTGMRIPVLYNILGGDWEPVVMNAITGGAGSFPVSMSLLELEEPSLIAGTSASHDPCFSGGGVSSSSRSGAKKTKQ